MRRNLDALKVSLQEPTQVGAMVLASLILEAHELRRSGALSTDELLKLHDGTPLDDLRENLVRIARELSAVSARLPEGQDQQVNDLVHELVKQTKALGPTI